MAIIKRNYDAKAAVECFYKYPHELGTPEIMQIFGVKRVTAGKLKKAARELMAERDLKPTRQGMVNTKCLYEAHGIDIKEAERTFEKLKKLGVYGQPEKTAEKPKLEVLKGAAQ